MLRTMVLMDEVSEATKASGWIQVLVGFEIGHAMRYPIKFPRWIRGSDRLSSSHTEYSIISHVSSTAFPQGWFDYRWSVRDI